MMAVNSLPSVSRMELHSLRSPRMASCRTWDACLSTLRPAHGARYVEEVDQSRLDTDCYKIRGQNNLMIIGSEAVDHGIQIFDMKVCTQAPLLITISNA